MRLPLRCLLTACHAPDSACVGCGLLGPLAGSCSGSSIESDSWPVPQTGAFQKLPGAQRAPQRALRHGGPLRWHIVIGQSRPSALAPSQVPCQLWSGHRGPTGAVVVVQSSANGAHWPNGSIGRRLWAGRAAANLQTRCFRTRCRGPRGISGGGAPTFCRARANGHAARPPPERARAPATSAGHPLPRQSAPAAATRRPNPVTPADARAAHAAPP